MENESNNSDRSAAGKRHENGHGTTTPSDLRDAFQDVSTSLGEFYRAADAFATQQTRERPHVVLGVAAGIGFVLGGGLASRLGGTLLNLGARFAVGGLLDQWIRPAEEEPPENTE